MARKYSYVRVPYQHPGFPDIPFIDIFKQKALQRFDEGQQELDKIAQRMRVKDGPKGESLRKRKNAINAGKKQDGMMRFDAYFDSTAYEIVNKEIREQIKLHMKDYMESSLDRATRDTANHIKNMNRQFKGKINPSKKASGDLYETIADSLKWQRKVSTRQANQFTGYMAGSFEDNSLTGVKGSRGANLIDLLGKGSFTMTTSPFGGTKRLGPSSKISKFKRR